MKFSELPKSIQSIFPGVDKKYTDFRCYVRVYQGAERYYVHFNGVTTRFVWRENCWCAEKSW